MKNAHHQQSENVIWFSNNKSTEEEKEPVQNEVKTDAPPPLPHPEKKKIAPEPKSDDTKTPKKGAKKTTALEFYSEAIKTALSPGDWQDTYAKREQKKRMFSATKTTIDTSHVPQADKPNSEVLTKLEEQIHHLKKQGEEETKPKNAYQQFSDDFDDDFI